MATPRRLLVALATALLLGSAARCQRAPTISYISQEQIKDLGSNVELTCKVQYSQDYPVLWIKLDRTRYDQMPISSNAALIVPDGRFSLRVEPATSSYTLRIDDIQETDAGYYQCQILISTHTKVAAEVELTVRRSPIINDNSTRSLLVSEGQSVRLECYADGYPKPRVSWRRENNARLPTGGSIFRGGVLRVPAVRKEHRGTYYCVAENGVGRGARRNVNLEVEFAPVIEAKRPRLGQALQYDMDLECHVVAYPPPAISWHKDHRQLANNQHYSVSHFATADEYTDTTLRVISIEKKQFGDYVCRAANKLGSAETTVHLFETVVPVCPPACGQAFYTSG
ncbi:lachesin-like [Phymastichus coffea]|uniref:lachesin-like n=1 Tax=Phymastichus coffea TaxID=108790 RepID=UPI00273BBE1A|nr:lachesin-like [Phymastichus coffea]